MAKITNRTGLNIGTELVLDEVTRKYRFFPAGNLNAKDGVKTVAFYSKLVDLWSTSEYQDSPFPMNTIDSASGQFQVGINAQGIPNGWGPFDQFSRDVLRDGGCEEYDDAGNLTSAWAGVVGLGNISSGSQAYYQLDPADAPTDFTFDDMPNAMVQVYGDVNNGNFDKRSYFKTFVREQGKLYTDSVLADTGKAGTGPFLVNFLLTNSDDSKITDLDSEMTNAPYDGINVTYYASNQQREIGGVDYDFDIIIDGNNATLEQIYTKVQYLLRQDADIDEGSGSVTGKTAALLCGFTGNNLNTTRGVFIDRILGADSNRISFADVTDVPRENPFEAAGVLTFNPVMVIGGDSSRRLFYTIAGGSLDDYGEENAITVKDVAGNEITGNIDSGSISFDFDYDNDSEGGPAGTDKEVTLIGIAPGSSKFAVAQGTLTRSKAISIGLVAEVDRAYET